MLTHTRKYGGVSQTRIASIMRCMFPYKRFAEAEGETSKKAAEVEHILAAATSTSRCVPADGNTHRGMTQWTRSERQKFQAVLLQCSRWEVDYANELIKSTKCGMQTSNPDSICDACLAVSLDDSLLHAIRKVRLCTVVSSYSFHLLFPRKIRKLAFLPMPVKCYSINVNNMLPIITCVPSRIVSSRIS